MPVVAQEEEISRPLGLDDTVKKYNPVLHFACMAYSLEEEVVVICCWGQNRFRLFAAIMDENILRDPLKIGNIR